MHQTQVATSTWAPLDAPSRTRQSSTRATTGLSLSQSLNLAVLGPGSRDTYWVECSSTVSGAGLNPPGIVGCVRRTQRFKRTTVCQTCAGDLLLTRDKSGLDSIITTAVSLVPRALSSKDRLAPKGVDVYQWKSFGGPRTRNLDVSWHLVIAVGQSSLRQSTMNTPEHRSTGLLHRPTRTSKASLTSRKDGEVSASRE